MSSRHPVFLSDQVKDSTYFVGDLSPPLMRSITVVCAGREKCQPDYTIQRDSFRYYSVEVVLEGKGQVTLNQQIHTLEPGAVFSYGPGTPHQITADHADPPLKVFIDFIGTNAQSLLEQIQLSPGTFRLTDQGAKLEQVWGLLLTMEDIDVSIRDHCLISTMNLITSLLTIPHIDQAQASSRSHATYLRCRAVLESSYQEIMSLEQLANKCGYAIPYLCRLFQKYSEQTPYQALIQLKMRDAAAALIRSQRPVQNIAQDSGYDDPYHFSRVFKRCFGMSPSSFRNQTH